MIFKRQKIFLSLLFHAQRQLSRTEIMKWLFLLRQETELESDPSFYNFVPYKYGPFSFLAYRDMTELEREGYLTPQKTSITPSSRKEVELMVSEVSLPIHSHINELIEKYMNLSQQELINLVYDKYPWFASRSEIHEKKDMNQQLRAKPAVYTSGYEGKSIDSFIQQLLKKGINTLIDVRNNPLSRKYGFSKSALNKICNDVQIEYTHYPELGIPSSYRTQLNSVEDYDRLFQLYVSNILCDTLGSQDKVVKTIKENPSALLCFEEDPRFCHRSHLANALSTASQLDVIHL